MIRIHILTVKFQEIDEMLSNSLSLDEEEAVQAELRKLQDEAVCVLLISCLAKSFLIV